MVGEEKSVHLLRGIHELAIDSFETLQIYNDNRTKWSPMTAKQESQTQQIPSKWVPNDPRWK